VNRYRLHDLTFDSSLHLPELDRSSAPPEFTVVEGPLAAVPDAWIDPWERDPRGPWIRVQRHDGYRVRYDGQVDFHLSRDGQVLTLRVIDCAPATVRHFLLDQVIPLALSLRCLVLHASASVVDGHAIAFTGPSGAGKSSLAAMLALDGHPIAADDALVLRRRGDSAAAGLEALPAYPGLRLWPDMIDAFAPAEETAPVSDASPKRRVRADLPFSTSPARLSALYFVSAASAPPERITIEPLTLRDTAMLFIEFGFRLEQREPARLADEIDRACDAASRVAAWSLRYPRDAARRHDVAAAVVAHVRREIEYPCCG
jgi:hypothetical protein